MKVPSPSRLRVVASELSSEVVLLKSEARLKDAQIAALELNRDAMLSRISQLTLQVDCGLLLQLQDATARAERAEKLLEELKTCK